MDPAPPDGHGDEPRSRSGGERRSRDEQAAHLVDLMIRTAEREQAAFAELYDLTAGRVYGAALRVLRSPEHAEEVAQEVYAEVWQQAHRYAPEKGSVVGWMSMMTHRRAVDRVRSVTSEVARDERYAWEGMDRESDEVWDSVAQSYEVGRVRQAMVKLSRLQRQALQLAYYEGMTQSQISEFLDVPLGTVKTRIRDALKHLGRALDGGS